MSDLFLNISPWARKTTAKMNKWDYIKNIFVNDRSDKGLTSKIYKELTHLSKQKANNPIKKCAEELNSFRKKKIRWPIDT